MSKKSEWQGEDEFLGRKFKCQMSGHPESHQRKSENVNGKFRGFILDIASVTRKIRSESHPSLLISISHPGNESKYFSNLSGELQHSRLLTQ